MFVNLVSNLGPEVGHSGGGGGGGGGVCISRPEFLILNFDSFMS